jgi:hypothetical protein
LSVQREKNVPSLSWERQVFDPVTILGLVSLALLVIGAGGYLLKRTPPDVETHPGEMLVPISEWKASGKIDFGCSEVPEDERASALFVLRCEEYRFLQSSTGARRIEVRWRDATLAEAKQVASLHNARPRMLGGESGASIRDDLAVARSESEIPEARSLH